jgi:hypothetical protein
MRCDHILVLDPFVGLASFDPFFVAVVQFVTSGRRRGWLSSFRSAVPGCCAENSVHACGAAIGLVALGMAAVMTGWAALTASMASFRGVAADDRATLRGFLVEPHDLQAKSGNGPCSRSGPHFDMASRSKSARRRSSQLRKDFLLNVVSPRRPSALTPLSPFVELLIARLGRRDLDLDRRRPQPPKVEAAATGLLDDLRTVRRDVA